MKRAKYLFPVLAAVSLLTGMQVSAEGYGQGRERDAMNRPAGAVTFQAQYAASGAFALSDDPQRIVLTFDQGYENGYTAKILDTLKEKHVTAIFFLTGDYARKEPALIKRMIAEGHARQSRHDTRLHRGHEQCRDRGGADDASQLCAAAVRL